jgi:DNA-binding protein HU-beta
MNKAELVDALAGKLNLSKKDVGAVVDGIVTEITQVLAKGDKLQIVGFGTFETSNRSGRTGRNPATGEAINIPARRVPKFSPGKALKDVVNGG